MERDTRKPGRLPAVVHRGARPPFAALLAVSRFTSRRGTIFTPDAVVWILGILTTSTATL